ncbi:MAG: hypothetical protein PF570_00985 [Candidatus Cloacimonetes bacterium]|jgi:hypothetical protein|nr:hypothetical protein [Candidatus Cloacimonadota bacterium]
MIKAILTFYIVLIAVQINCIEWDLTHHIALTTTLYDELNKIESELNYKPEISINLYQMHNYLIDIEFSYDINLNYRNTEDHDFEITGNLYRGWLRYSSSQAEIRIGLQKINFGPAQILRSLQWFDSMNPHDPTKTTEGVKAILGRYYFINNTNIWLWGVWGDREETSINKFFYEEDNLEFGGRVQYPFKYCETGFTAHHRKIDDPTFDYETKYGLDLRWDMAFGFWIESGLNVYQNAENSSYLRLFSIGTDYTFGIGNGIYCLFEHQYFSELKEDFWESIDKPGASSMLMSYPLGMFDSIKSIITYNWQSEFYYCSFSFNRNYDYLSIYINLLWNSFQSDHSGIDSMEDGTSIQLILETKF